MSGRLLLVEDDALLASSLSRALAANGYTVDVSHTVAEALAAVDDTVPDLVLLDLGLPDGDGDEVCEHMVRNHPHVPVMVVTARADEIDVVAGLTRGAVDYVAKPFRLAELLARVRSHLRMSQAAAESDRTGVRDTLVIGDLTIDRSARRVHVGDEELGLRPKEFDVLDLLARHAGTVVTREQLIDDVWDENWWGSTKTLDVHINSIRRKLGEHSGDASRIATIRGIGYRLDGIEPGSGAEA
jgi:DNA-binding response OmpR family regulator